MEISFDAPAEAAYEELIRDSERLRIIVTLANAWGELDKATIRMVCGYENVEEL